MVARSCLSPWKPSTRRNDRLLTDCRILDTSHFAQIRAMSWRAAHRIAVRRVHGKIEIGALRGERIVARRIEFLAGLPPAMLANDDARIELVIEAGLGSHAARRCLNGDPAAGRDAARRCRVGMQFDLRVLCALSQAWQGAMLRLAEECGLRASEHQREPRDKIGTCDGA